MMKSAMNSHFREVTFLAIATGIDAFAVGIDLINDFLWISAEIIAIAAFEFSIAKISIVKIYVTYF